MASEFTYTELAILSHGVDNLGCQHFHELHQCFATPLAFRANVTEKESEDMRRALKEKLTRMEKEYFETELRGIGLLGQ